MASRSTQDVSVGSQSNDNPAQEAQDISETSERQNVNHDNKTRNRTRVRLTDEQRSLFGKDGSRKGQIKTLADGSIKYWRQEDSKWIPATYHDDIRAPLLAESPQGTYEIVRSRGPTVNDVTSFHPDYQTNGPNREDRHKILFRYLEDELTAPDYTPPVWYYHGHIVLDSDNHPVRKWNEIPLVLSSQFEGFDMETIRRLNTNITLRDFRARMPRFVTKGSNPTLLDIYGLSTLGMRITRFRLMSCCIAWTDREGGDLIKRYVDSILPPECKAENSTENFRDLTDYEIELVKEGNRGHFMSRAGKRALDPETRHARIEAEKRRMVRLKAEHDVILANFENKLPQKPVSKRRSRKRNCDKLVSSRTEDDGGNNRPSKRQNRTNGDSTISLQPTNDQAWDHFSDSENLGYEDQEPMEVSNQIPEGYNEFGYEQEPMEVSNQISEGYDESGYEQEPMEVSNQISEGYDEFGYEQEPTKTFVADGPAIDVSYAHPPEGLELVNEAQQDSPALNFGLDFIDEEVPDFDFPVTEDEQSTPNSAVLNSGVDFIDEEVPDFDFPVTEDEQSTPNSAVLNFGLDYHEQAVPDFDFPEAESESSIPISPNSESLEPENTEAEISHSLPLQGPPRPSNMIPSAPQLTNIQPSLNNPVFRTNIGYPLPAQRPFDFRFQVPSTWDEQNSIQQALEHTRQDYRSWTGILEPSPTDPRKSYADQYDQMQEELCDNWRLGGETAQLYCVDPFTDTFFNWVGPPPGTLIPIDLLESFP